MDIIEELNNTMSVLDMNHYDINYGGCGAVAAIIGNLLKDKCKVRVALMPSWGGGKTEDFADIRNDLRNNCDDESISDWYDRGISFGHAWIEFCYKRKWYAIDSGHCVPYKEFPNYRDKYNEHMTLEDMEVLGDNPHGWNSHFDRSQLPEIKETLEIEILGIITTM